MKTEELLLLAVGGAALYFLVIKKPTPVVTTVQAPSVAPMPAYSPAYGFPSNTMNGAPYASGGYTQRSDAQDAAAIIGAIGGLAKNVSDIASSWT